MKLIAAYILTHAVLASAQNDGGSGHTFQQYGPAGGDVLELDRIDPERDPHGEGRRRAPGMGEEIGQGQTSASTTQVYGSQSSAAQASFTAASNPVVTDSINDNTDSTTEEDEAESTDTEDEAESTDAVTATESTTESTDAASTPTKADA